MSSQSSIAADPESRVPAAPLAVVQGQPLTELPRDLYIPPEALEVFLETFEGPLDLLLYLIRRQNLSILDVDVADITRQYMAYVNMMDAMQFELAAEYLVMAALLAEIKSRMLLPRSADVDDEEEDPRALLIRRLQQYERYKLAAEELDALPRVGREVHLARAQPPPLKQRLVHPEVSLEELLRALAGVLHRADLFESHQVQREQLSTRQRMGEVLARLSGKGFLPFVALFSPAEGRAGVVVTFLAVLELQKESLVELIQVEERGAIHIRAKTS